MRGPPRRQGPPEPFEEPGNVFTGGRPLRMCPYCVDTPLRPPGLGDLERCEGCGHVTALACECAGCRAMKGREPKPTRIVAEQRGMGI